VNASLLLLTPPQQTWLAGDFTRHLCTRDSFTVPYPVASFNSWRTKTVKGFRTSPPIPSGRRVGDDGRQRSLSQPPFN